ncbi:MAG: alpha/beta hydrolase [Bacteriovorax sp.]|nr:alpha/beta hydrolase [Bacteriovorax sp.]
MNNNRWIFLRGLTRGNIHWSVFPEIFKKINPDAQMEFLEIPGNGLCSEEKSPVSAGALLDSLRIKSNFVKNKESFHLCGISLGGMAAMKWAESYPGEVLSVAVINSSLAQFSTFNKRLLPENYETLLRTLFMHGHYQQEESVLKITSNRFEETKKNLEAFAVFSENHKVTKINFLRQLILAKSININSVVKKPFKVISSQNDRLVDHGCSKQIVLKLGGKEFIHPTAGHDLPLDEPEWLSEILVKNLECTASS